MGEGSVWGTTDKELSVTLPLPKDGALMIQGSLLGVPLAHDGCDNDISVILAYCPWAPTSEACLRPYFTFAKVSSKSPGHMW